MLRARLEQLRYLHIPTSSLAICFSEMIVTQVQTLVSITERQTCPQPAAFLSRPTHIIPSTYVYTSFVSDLILEKTVVVGKTSSQIVRLQACSGCIFCAQVAIITLSYQLFSKAAR